MLLDGLLEVVAIRHDLFDEPPARSPRQTLIAQGAEALICFASIPIAYAVSPSLAKWFWLLLIPSSRADRRRMRGRGNEKDAKAAA